MEKKKLFVRLIVPVLIAVVIAVIWIVKTRPEPAESDSDSNADKAGVNADFILEADSIDLETLTAYGLPIMSRSRVRLS